MGFGENERTPMGSKRFSNAKTEAVKIDALLIPLSKEFSVYLCMQIALATSILFSSSDHHQWRPLSFPSHLPPLITSSEQKPPMPEGFGAKGERERKRKV